MYGQIANRKIFTSHRIELASVEYLNYNLNQEKNIFMKIRFTGKRNPGKFFFDSAKIILIQMESKELTPLSRH